MPPPISGGGRGESSVQPTSVRAALFLRTKKISSPTTTTAALSPTNKRPVDWRNLLKVSCYGIAVIHGDDGCSGPHTGDGVDITSPVNKPVASLGLGHQIDHHTRIIGEDPLPRSGYITASGARNGKIEGGTSQIPFGKLDLRACGDHGAVGLKPHRVTAACGDLDNVRPAADIALPVVVSSHGDHGAVGLKPHGVTEPAATWTMSVQLPTSHCPESFYPTAITVPSDLSPTV